MSDDLTLLEVKDVSKVLGVSEARVYELMKRQGLPYIDSITKRRLVLRSELVAWVKSQSFSRYEDEEEGVEG